MTAETVKIIIQLSPFITGIITAAVAYMTYREGKRKNRHDELEDMNDRLRADNERLRRENERLRKENNHE